MAASPALTSGARSIALFSSAWQSEVAAASRAAGGTVVLAFQAAKAPGDPDVLRATPRATAPAAQAVTAMRTGRAIRSVRARGPERTAPRSRRSDFSDG